MRIAQEALTFDDVLLLPAYSNVLPRDVSWWLSIWNQPAVVRYSVLMKR